MNNIKEKSNNYLKLHSLPMRRTHTLEAEIAHTKKRAWNKMIREAHEEHYQRWLKNGPYRWVGRKTKPVEDEADALTDSMV